MLQCMLCHPRIIDLLTLLSSRHIPHPAHTEAHNEYIILSPDTLLSLQRVPSQLVDQLADLLICGRHASWLRT